MFRKSLRFVPFFLLFLGICLVGPLSGVSGLMAQEKTAGKLEEKPLPVDETARAKLVDDLAKALEEGYVFPDVAQTMAKSIREKLAGKSYDLATTGQALARALTADLQAVSKDKHIRVNCSTEPLPKRERKEPSAGDLARMREATRKRAAGFVKLERLSGNIGYLELRGFLDPEAGAETVAAAMSFLANTDALIIDLRKNGGGSPHMVQLLCSYFFPAEPKVHLNSLYWRKGDKTDEFWTLKDVAGPRYLDKPIYLLTSKLTFSAAEEFSYNLKNLKRVTIVGETTGGGAHPGGGVPLGDHFIVFVPTGRAINPITKTNWEGTGVAPDVAVDAEMALDKARELALAKILESIKDPQWKRELEMESQMELRANNRYKERNAKK